MTYREKAVELASRGRTWLWERRNPERNEFRQYQLSITQSAFNEFALIRHWGRIGGPLRKEVMMIGDEATVVAETCEQLCRRLQHQYSLVAVDGLPV